MKNLSIAVVDGFLTGDPELKKISSGKSVANFTLAVNHNFKKIEGEEPEVSYLEVEVWDRSAENCAEYLKKGKKATVIGYIKQDRWKNQEGQNRSKLKIVAEEVRFDSYGDRKEREAA
ncbi:single-stranded DNA-binding protein [Leptospira fluminis]|uniref:Single-stranded DNA-binding protein n=1 Tax=Leptospira fluminis TaxID=2484979 RepID=A0A4R9GSP2_9LEPT|nr:single-stranded DNA-binding protein [Leptospira fluminis]TGK20815.1 single-stranded DNA-binding protein [Leptospira fluminis]